MPNGTPNGTIKSENKGKSSVIYDEQKRIGRKAPRKKTIFNADTGEYETLYRQKPDAWKTRVAQYGTEKPTRKKTKFADPQRGAKKGTAVGNALRSIFGGGGGSKASDAKGFKERSSNPRKREKQISKSREGRKNKCAPGSRNKSCGPSGR